MVEPILSDEQRELVAAERELLTEVRAALERIEVAAEDRRALADSVRQLDELFLIVVVGEFNAGKSAFVNALLGEPLLAEGVTPTTAKIHLLTWGDTRSRQPVGAAGERITAPLEALRELSFVDTPGTNALDRVHEALTTDYVPRADLVLFVTSADRPLSESERQFLESIAGWGKKLVLLVNKVDILPSKASVAEVEAYIRDHARRLLDLEPPVLALSVRAARAAADGPGLEASGLPAVERFLEATLAPAERVRLKLASPLGVADRVLQAALVRVAEAQAKVTANLQYQIENTGSKGFRLRLPAAAENVRFTGEQIADFLELRLQRHPKMIGAIMRKDGIPFPPRRSDLEQYATQLTLVVVQPVDQMTP